MREIVLRFRFGIRRRIVRCVGLDCRGEAILGAEEIWSLVSGLRPMLPSRSSELYHFAEDLGSVVSHCL